MNAYEVYMSPLKEPHYFSSDIRVDGFTGDYKKGCQQFSMKTYLSSDKLESHHIAFVEEWEQYIDLFREVDTESVIGEASTGYLYSGAAAKGIYNAVPDARIVMILRNPVERAFSHYKMDLANGAVCGEFYEEFCNDSDSHVQGWGVTHLYRDLGLYSQQVQRYLDVFPRENIRIYLYEDWSYDNHAILNDLASFLRISPFEVEERLTANTSSLQPKNLGLMKLARKMKIGSALRTLLPKDIVGRIKGTIYKPISVKLTPDDRKRLSSLFAQDIICLESLLDRDLSAWK